MEALPKEGGRGDEGNLDQDLLVSWALDKKREEGDQEMIVATSL